jgi:hypothetical protein|tara:strand:- start:216 stop:662 length:447 start_codon:yes stop_codon:yes gene_type:complete
MATTVEAANLTVTITETYNLNGVDYGNTMNKTYTSNGQVLQRIMNVSASDPAIINFGAGDEAGQVVADDYKYFRITNLDDTNFITLTLYNGNDSFFYKLLAGDSFLLMSNEMDAVDESTSFGAFADITQIKADADTEQCDIEIIAVTA